MSLPLSLTSNQQSCLAEICELARTELYRLQTSNDIQYTNQELQNIGRRFDDLLLQWADVGISPQQFDEMYDKLHRTGANY